MVEGKTFLVGSLPFEDEGVTMDQALNILNGSWLRLPYGEIGEKSNPDL
ncbi:hypothetical protein [Alkalihalobacillus sp. TS-13]|nr:hypothetical protein [Alkalihalobacillus sp. TS-13]